jgi:hypothetical protein
MLPIDSIAWSSHLERGVLAKAIHGSACAAYCLQALRDQLSPGSSVLLVLLEPVWRDKLDAALASYDGMSTRCMLRGVYAQDQGAHEAIAEMREATADQRGGRA